MLAVQLTTHVKSSTLYGRTAKFFRLDGSLLFCIIVGLRSASSATISYNFSSRKLAVRSQNILWVILPLSSLSSYSKVYWYNSSLPSSLRFSLKLSSNLVFVFLIPRTWNYDLTYLVFCNVHHELCLHKLLQDVFWCQVD